MSGPQREQARDLAAAVQVVVVDQAFVAEDERAAVVRPEVQGVDAVGGTAVGVDASPTPVALLEPNFPNPFNPQTTLSYSLAADGRVRLSIVDVNGRELATLVDAEQAAGRYAEVWDGRDAVGHPLASGVYVARLETGGQTRAQKMVLAR